MSQLSMFPKINKDKIIQDLFQAYFSARKNKRNTINCLAFEKHFEVNIFKLYGEILKRKYTPKNSTCFIVNKPVKREIFAANFRDRIVHHFMFNYISPIFEKIFINDCYSCRKGKGTHYGIKRIDHFIRSCSNNYTKNCYILKLDIQGYFMAINKKILYKKVTTELFKQADKLNFDLSLVLYLLYETIYNNPTINCIRKGNIKDWDGLPQSKSLFYTKPDCGLPIGNLTSQLFGNIYMNQFDHWVKHNLGIKYYGRYVDDFILVHNNKEYLKACISKIEKHLKESLELVLHPNKIYLQQYKKGVQYLGAVIKPHRTYIANRTKGNFYSAIENYNMLLNTAKLNKEQQQLILTSINSYLGIMKHFKTYKFRKQILLKYLSKHWSNYASLSKNISKFEKIMWI